MAKAVNAEDYGAKGDGTTDDTAALQRAIDAAGPGGVVTLEGTSRITGSLLGRGTTFTGGN